MQKVINCFCDYINIAYELCVDEDEKTLYG